ncbi:MAG: glycosyltransferase family 2 protein [Chlamydiae bacterium]|nr:glycosyltransferase family 2 protein [Chlamydiota bacterium]
MRRYLSFKPAVLAIASLTALFIGLTFFHPVKRKNAREKNRVSQDKSFVVIIPSFNNSSYVEKNLQSVLQQKYKNFRLIYIDDHSTDDTYEKASRLIRESGLQQRAILIRNEENLGALANIYRAVHSCDDREIVVLVDGDDYLAHEYVLTKLNKIYSSRDVWVTYGNFLNYPDFTQKPVSCKKFSKSVIRNNQFRKKEWVASHLRSFYVGLFKKIKLKDFIYRGRFFPMAGDLAVMFPLLEMSRKHTAFIKDILYLYNRTNPLSDHKIHFQFQQECTNAIRKAKPYAKVKKRDLFINLPTHEANFLIFASDPFYLLHLLDSIEKFSHKKSHIFVLFPSRDEYQNQFFSSIQQKFPNVEFLFQEKKNLKNFLLETLKEKISSPYLLLLHEKMVFQDFFNLSKAVEAVESTKSYGFFFNLGTDEENGSNLIKISNNLFGWQLSLGSGNWEKYAPLNGLLLKKIKLESEIERLHFDNVNSFVQEWEKLEKKKRIGLCYAKPKILNLEMNCE